MKTPRMNDLCANCGRRFGDHYKEDVEPGNPIPPLACPDGSPAGYTYTACFKAATTPAPERKPTLIEAIEKAREATRLAELEVRNAASAAVGEDGGRVAWIVLYDLIEPQVRIADKLTLLGQLAKKEEKVGYVLKVAGDIAANMAAGTVLPSEVDWAVLQNQLRAAAGIPTDQ